MSFRIPLPEYMPRPAIVPVRKSTVKTYQVCPRKFLYEHRLNLELVRKPRAKALEVGTVFHACLQDYYTGKDEALRKAEAEIRDQEKDKTLGDLTEAMKESNDNISLGRAMFECFIAEYPTRPEVMATEQTISYKVRSPFGWITLRGTIDLIIQAKPGFLWAVDHKTYGGTNPEDRLAVAEFSVETFVYFLLLHHWIKSTATIGCYADGVMHNVMRKATIRFCGKDASFAAYVNRCKDWYKGEGKHEKYKDQRDAVPPMQQSWVSMNMKDVATDERWRILWDVARASRSRTIDLAAFPRNEESCFKWNRHCEFLGLCKHDRRTWPARLDAYRVNNDRLEEAGGRLLGRDNPKLRVPPAVVAGQSEPGSNCAAPPDAGVAGDHEEVPA